MFIASLVVLLSVKALSNLTIHTKNTLNTTNSMVLRSTGHFSAKITMCPELPWMQGYSRTNSSERKRSPTVQQDAQVMASPYNVLF